MIVESFQIPDQVVAFGRAWITEHAKRGFAMQDLASAIRRRVSDTDPSGHIRWRSVPLAERIIARAEKDGEIWYSRLRKAWVEIKKC